MTKKKRKGPKTALDPSRVASATECTGLMAALPPDEEQAGAYEAVWPVQPAAQKSKNNDRA